jgi:hypothetical protein
MWLLRNKTSGMDFIGLEEDAQESVLRMITPEGKIKALERRFFEAVEPLAVDAQKERLMKITAPQREKFQQITGKSIPGR